MLPRSCGVWIPNFKNLLTMQGSIYICTNLSFAQSPPPMILPALADEILTFLFLKKMFWYACMAISAQALLAE